MDRILRFLAALFLFVVIIVLITMLGGIRRNVAHRNILINSAIFNGKNLYEIVPNISQIQGGAWRTSEGEFGYFQGRIRMPDKDLVVFRISEIMGIQPNAGKTDMAFIQSKWNSVFRQFSDNGLYLNFSPNKDLDYYNWTLSHMECDLTMERQADDFVLYLTWYQRIPSGSVPNNGH